jgi:hypothetical protein
MSMSISLFWTQSRPILSVIIISSWHEVWSCVCWTVFSLFGLQMVMSICTPPHWWKNHMLSQEKSLIRFVVVATFFSKSLNVFWRDLYPTESQNAGLFYPRVSCVMLLVVLKKSQHGTGQITSRMFISHESMLYCVFLCIEHCNKELVCHIQNNTESMAKWAKINRVVSSEHLFLTWHGVRKFTILTMTCHKKVRDFKLKTFVKLIGILLTSVFMKIFKSIDI